MQPITVSAIGIAAATDNIAAPQSVTAATTLTLTALAASLDSPSQIVLETNADYTGIDFTVIGTDANGSVITEVLAGPNTTSVNSTLYYKSITSIRSSAGVGGGAVEVGTTGSVTSRWARMDSWANAQAVVQVNTSGTLTYSVETSMDDPNDPTYPIAVIDMTWLDALDPNLVAETADKSGFLAYTPTWVRLKGSGGTGIATMKIAQFSNAPY